MHISVLESKHYVYVYVTTLVWETKVLLHGMSSCQINFMAVTNKDSRLISMVLLRRRVITQWSLGVLHSDTEVVIKICFGNAVKNL